ncbi:MAG: hypothetical protein ACRDNW_24695 [Trebonia sp.]
MFAIYVLFLILSGIAMLVMASVRTGYARRRQALNFIFGAGFLSYGLYLLLAFNGGSYIMFYYVFVIPVLMIVNFFRDRSAAKARQASHPTAQGGFPPAGTPWGTDPGPGTWANGPTPGNGQPNGGYGQPTGNGQGVGN